MLLALFALALRAPAQSYQVFNYRDLEGLPSSATLDVDQESGGLLWIATRRGLASFDGVRFRTLTAADGLRDTECAKVCCDDSGNVWVAHTFLNAGLSSWDGRTCRTMDGPLLRSPVRVSSLLVVDSQPVVGTLGEGLFVRQGSQWLRPEALGSGDVLGLAFRQHLYVATRRGLVMLNTSGWTKVALPAALPEGAVRGVLVEEDRLWCAGDGWVGYLQDGGFTRCPVDGLPAFDAKESVSLAADGRGGIFLSAGRGTVHWTPGSTRLEPLGTRQGFVNHGAFDLMMDPEGNLWSCGFRGLSRMPPPRFANFTSDHELLADEVTAIAEQGGVMVLGHLGGLSFRSGQGWEPLDFLAHDDGALGSPDTRVSELAEDHQGNLWAAVSNRGVARVRPTREIDWFSFRGCVHSILVDQDGVVQMLSDQGMWRLEGDRFELHPAGSKLAGRRLAQAPDGRLYIGSFGQGLLVQDGEVWKEIRRPGRSDANNIYSISFLASGRVLVGTWGGVFELRGDRLEGPEDLPAVDGPVFFVREDSGRRLWLGTDQGVVRVEGGQATRYTMREGLAGQETNRAASWEDQDGRVWIGTITGVSCYQAEFDGRVGRPPVVTLLGMSTREGLLRADHPIEVAYERSEVHFHFRAVSFLYDGSVQFRYRLAGWEDWQSDLQVGGEQSVRYSFLPAGDYRFEVEASNRSGQWSEAARSATIHVRGPWWRSAWFLASVVLLALLLGYAGHSLLNARRRSRELTRSLEQSHAELAASEARFRAMFDKSQAPALLVHPGSGRIEAANVAAQKLFGCEADEILGAPLWNRINTPEPVVQAELNRCTESSGNEVVIRLTSSAEGRQLQAYGHAQRYAGRTLVHLTLHDVTEFKRLEEELQQAQKMNALGQLAGGIAHDFNNLLTAILVCSDLAREEIAESHRAFEEIEEIHHSAQRGVALVRQLLSFSRKQQIAPEIADLNRVIQETVEILHRILCENVSIETRLDGNAGSVWADRTQIERMLINLAVNARDAMSTGGLLTIETEACGRPPHIDPSVRDFKRWVHLTVTDTGTGISAEHLERIFEPFYSTKEKGTGLGLPTVFGIIKQSQGDIRIDSQPGHGTTVHVWLPEAPDGPLAEEGVPRSTGASGQGQTVLLVEDDAPVRITSAKMLRASGYEVVESGSAAEALVFLSKQAPTIDLLITDVVMPGMDGCQLAAEVAQKYPGIRIVFMSGYAGDAMIQDAIHRNTPFLQKPFTSLELNNTVRSVLGA